MTFDDFGNDVATALHLHPVADFHAQALDLIHVVKGRVADGGAADRNRRQFGDRRELAGTPHLYADAFNFRDARARGVLVGNRPARRLAGKTQFGLEGSAIDLDDDAIDFVGQRLALFFPALDEFPDLLHIFRHGPVLVDLEPRGFERLQSFGVAVEVGAAVLQAGCKGRKSRRRLAVMLASSWRTVPAVALRGFANKARPLASRSSFIFLKDAAGISSSPRTSKSAGTPAFFSFSFGMVSGIERTVRMLSVTSSPTEPSPRVTPRASLPVFVDQRQRHAVEL